MLGEQMCKAIDDPRTGNNTFAKLYSAANIYYNYTGTSKCFNLADSPDPHGLRMWSWQVPTPEHILPPFILFITFSEALRHYFSVPSKSSISNI